MTQEQIQEIRYLVGEAWKGAYNPTTVYGNANVVQDTEGLSVYRSLKPGNSGHPLTDQQWWFKIIDMSSIKALYDQMVEGNNTMAENELERVAAEQSRVSAEQSRVNAENARIYNENQRINDETTRVRAEQDRVTQENQRISQEQGRVGAEQQRVAKEQQRVNQEASRVAAETQRQLNENDRQAVFAEDHAVAVADHQQAEQDHTRAESDHETAVSDHGQMTDLVNRADADHVQAGNDHTRAESDHTTASSDHTQAGQDHTTATSDHEQATTDHTRAESDHATAYADHQQAVQDHETATEDHTTYAGNVLAAQTAAENAASSAATSMQQATAAAGSAAQTEQYVQDIMTAMENLPDGQAVSAQVAVNTADITQLKDVVADLETIAEGYVRVAGSSSPALSYKSYKYHEQGGFGRESVFSLFYPCLVGTPLTGSGTEGKVLHVLQKFGARTIDGTPKWLDIYGTPHAIDGSEGDVMIVNIEPFYSINGKHTIEGTEYDVFLMSRTPFTWQGIEAEHMEKFGWAPDYTVAHQDTDNVIRMHSVYNPAWNGSYTAPVGVAGKYVYSVDSETGDIVETYDANETLLGGAGGLHSTDINLPNGEQYAMNNNDDTTKTVPWMNQTAEGCNRLMSLILSEGGTFDAHNANLMGSGFCSNDPATAAGDWEQAGSGAKNGLRVMDKNGAWKYYALSGNVRFLTGATTGTVYAANVINSWRNPWHMLEANRAMSYAIVNDVHELEWFVFEGNKYKYRSVQGFNGPSHGEMTCVVWKLIATQAGANAIDPTDNVTNIAGNRVEILVSTALIHGMMTQVSPLRWTSGLLFTEDENGQYECYLERDQAELVKGIAADNYDPATPRDFETIYDHVLTVQKGEGYAKNYLNGALMLPDTNANKSGAGLHTYVGKYNWFTGGNASAGKKSVRGFLRGAGASDTVLSPLTLGANVSPSYAYSAVGFGTCCRIAE